MDQSKDIEQLFIREILDQHGEYLFDLLTGQIEDKNLIKEGELLDSLRYQVRMEGDSPVLSISFYSYGRVIEINYYKKSSNTRKWQAVNTNKLLWGVRENSKLKKKKDTAWYTRSVYGSLNRLIGRLSTEFTEQEIARLKNILSLQQQQGYTFQSPITSAI